MRATKDHAEKLEAYKTEHALKQTTEEVIAEVTRRRAELHAEIDGMWINRIERLFKNIIQKFTR